MKKKFKVFIDGEAGTTGLQIRQRLQKHPDIDIISIEHALRKDIDEKLKLLKTVDITILCLPDDASKEAVDLISTHNIPVRILDASSAHRTHPEWVYGLPELNTAQRSLIQKASKVSNPGCYATGGVLLLRPLIDAGLLPPEAFIAINAISGYSGGGRQMIEKYESTPAPSTYGLYGLEFKHKHTPEIQQWALLKRRPAFIPAVGNYAQGMLVHTIIDHQQFTQAISPADLHALIVKHYESQPFIKVMPLNELEMTTAPFLTPHSMSGKNSCEISLYSSEEFQQSLLVAKLDNLGKGASGACVQNLNIMLGLPEDTAVELNQ